MSLALFPVLALVACRADGPALRDTHTAAEDTGGVADSGTPDSTSDSSDTGDSGRGETGDSTDTGQAGDTADSGDGIPAQELNIGTAFDARIVGDEAGAGTSYRPHVALATGDMDGDGDAEVAFGEPCSSLGGTCSGATFVVHGPVTGTMNVDAADTTVAGAAGESAGFSLATGDVDGDGLTDLLIGAPWAGDALNYHGAAYLFLSPVSGITDVSAADAAVAGSDNKQAAWSVSIPGDLDGDGRAEFGLSSMMFPDFGAVYVYAGSSRGSLVLGDAAAVVSGGDMGAWCGRGGDQDGDGLDDLFVAQGTATSRQLLLFHGPVSGSLTDSDADIAFTGVGFAGEPSAVGDVNGDGYVDTVLAEPTDGSGGYDAGAAFLWYGPVTADTDVSSSDASVLGEIPEARLGMSLATGDVNGDAADELLVGAPGSLGGIGGHSWLFVGPLYGSVALADAWAHFVGDGEDGAGYATALDDVDGDGLDDVIIGAPWDDAGAAHGGTVWIKYATSL